MIKCNSRRSSIIRDALTYLPYSVKREFQNSGRIIVILSTHDRFGYCFTPENDSFNILINDSIFPNGCHTREDRIYRFFVFTVLHEIAHAHLTLAGEPLGEQEEDRANELANNWYNEYAQNHSLPLLTDEERIEVQKIHEKNLKI